MNDNNRIYLQGVTLQYIPWAPLPKTLEDTYAEYIRCTNCCSMCMLSDDILCEDQRWRDVRGCEEWFRNDQSTLDRCMGRAHESYKGCLTSARRNCTRGCRCECPSMYSYDL